MSRLMVWIKKTLLYAGLEKKEFNQIQDLYIEPNNSLLKFIPLSFSALSLMFAIMATMDVDKALSRNFFMYLCVCIANLITGLYAIRKKKLSRTVQIILIGIFSLSFYTLGIYSGTYGSGDNLSVAFMIAVVMVPMVFNVRPIFSQSLMTVGTVIFCLLVGGHKSPSLAQIDVLDAITFSISGLILSSFILSNNARGCLASHKARETDRALKENDDIVANAGIGIWHIYIPDNGQSPRLRANAKMRELLAIPATMTDERDMYNAWFSNIKEESMETVNNGIATLLEGTPTEITYLWANPVAGDQYVRCGGFAERAKDGWNLKGYHSVVNNEVIRELRNQAILEAISQDYHTVWLIDENWNMNLVRSSGISTTRAAYEMCLEDARMNESMTWYVNTYVAEEDRPALIKAISRDYITKQLEKKDGFAINYKRLNEDKSFSYHQMAIAKVQGFGFTLSFRDVDALIHEEQEKQRVLEAALKAAEAANKAKTTFLNNMSHDIRTPMNAIIGFTSLAGTHLDNKEVLKDYLRKITTSSNHLLSLINDVLDMSRIESGRMKLDEKPCHLPSVMHDLKNVLQTNISSKRLNFLIDTIDVEHEDIICDKLRLNQILLNCMSNAVKFTPPGGTVGIRITQKPSLASGYVDMTFVVHDTGIGMSREFMKHIFEPFSREETSTVNGIQGTGLGMSITKTIVDMMGGEIEVQSGQGEGTSITISLSFKVCESQNSIHVIKKLEGLRALVADDNMDTCISVSKMLDSIGLLPEWTLSGIEAVYKAKYAHESGKPYHAFIIDWLMPDMNGVEVVRRIRQNIGDDTPIIIITAYDWSDIEKEARKAGVTAFCSKPLFISDLFDVLCSCIEKKEVKEPEELPQRPNYGAKRILLVEDNDLNREIATAMLSTSNVLIEEAENGKVAVEMFRTSREDYYDLILMDIQMPVLDGYSATREIRMLGRKDAKTIPIVAVSANAFEEDRIRSLEAGMNAHIAKPFNQAKIDDLLKTFLE